MKDGSSCEDDSYEISSLILNNEYWAGLKINKEECKSHHCEIKVVLSKTSGIFKSYDLQTK